MKVTRSVAIDKDLLIQAQDLTGITDTSALLDHALEVLITAYNQRARAGVGRQIVEGYRRMPETADELAGAKDNLDRMIDEEPW